MSHKDPICAFEKELLHIKIGKEPDQILKPSWRLRVWITSKLGPTPAPNMRI
jgi:hypothetical protein